MDKSKVLEAGKIASEVREYANSIIKKDMPLLEIAEKIENRIKELGGKPAFPTNLSINDIAAHYTPSHDDKTLASGLLKIDLGIHINGWIADTAFSLDLENTDEDKKLIEASTNALKNAIKLIENKSRGVAKNVEGVILSKIGKTIQETIESYGASPIVNLGGHGLNKYDFHAEPFIPNIDDKKNIILQQGLYAIEPFATSGNGKVYEGKPSSIYVLIDDKNVRNPLAREILKFIKEEYNTLPFCSRWIVKKFGAGALFGLKRLEENGNLHHFPQLIESSHNKVSQAEHTILVEEDEVIITTKS